MLLAIDVGNTQTVLGIFEGTTLEANWRISTRADETADEFAGMLSDLLALQGLSFTDISGVAVASVVPRRTAAIAEMATAVLGIDPLIVGPGVKTGMPILYDNPHEVGADRIADAVAGFAQYGGPIIVVDFGTATTFDAVSEKGEYMGGVIAPGLEVSAEALFAKAARLSRVDLAMPPTVIGKNTQNSVQAGVLLGSAGQVDAIVRKMKSEMGAVKKVIATGGLAKLVAPLCETVDEIDQQLTLIGLRIIFDMNQ